MCKKNVFTAPKNRFTAHLPPLKPQKNAFFAEKNFQKPLDRIGKICYTEKKLLDKEKPIWQTYV